MQQLFFPTFWFESVKHVKLFLFFFVSVTLSRVCTYSFDGCYHNVAVNHAKSSTILPQGSKLVASGPAVMCTILSKFRLSDCKMEAKSTRLIDWRDVSGLTKNTYISASISTGCKSILGER